MEKLDKIKLNSEVLESQGVGIVVVFGSKVTGAEHPKSDIDVGVVFFDKRKKRENPVEAYGTLYEEFKKNFETENIDIVYLEESPLSLQHKAVMDGIVLYQRSPVFFADYKEKIMIHYFDFRFFEKIFNEAIIKTK